MKANWRSRKPPSFSPVPRSSHSKIGADDWAYGAEGKSLPPALETKRYGKGTLAYLNRESDVACRNSAMKESLESLLANAAQRTAASPETDLKILVREKDGGEKYLCVCNRNVEKPIETTVTVKGKYGQALDIFAPGWFPVPSQTKGNETVLKIRLDPRDFTMILLKP
ncbi:MAG: hypothetical protein HY360_03355 [Verrucomicrobia bacterium]|nr:hypothetical protein [Verrucomicrobiota bacterium]